MLVLIDAYSQIFRSFYAIRHLTTSKGEPVNALFVFTRLLLDLAKKYPSERGAMLFDRGKVEFRLKLNPEYKANRPPMPDELATQMPWIKMMAEAFGWPLVSCPDSEADDLAGAFALAEKTQEVRIVSSDKDLSQLVDGRVKLVSPGHGNTGAFVERGEAEVKEKFGVAPKLIPDYLALVGDSSDNIPGVPGIGPKSAAELLNACGAIETWIDDPERLPIEKFRKKLVGQSEFLRKNLQLVRLRCELPAELTSPETLARRAPDYAKIAELCRRFEFNRILRDLPVPPPAAPEPDDALPLFSAVPAKEDPKSEEPQNDSATYEQGSLF